MVTQAQGDRTLGIATAHVWNDLPLTIWRHLFNQTVWPYMSYKISTVLRLSRR